MASGLHPVQLSLFDAAAADVDPDDEGASLDEESSDTPDVEPVGDECDEQSAPERLELDEAAKEAVEKALKGDRGTRLALLNQLAAVPDVTPRMMSAIRAIDDKARKGANWIGSHHELGEQMGGSPSTGRRGAGDLKRAMLLSEESAGARRIYDPHRKDRERRSTEALFDWMIDWRMVVETIVGHRKKRRHPARKPRQVGTLACQPATPAFQPATATSIRAETASTGSSSAPETDWPTEWAEAEERMQSRLNGEGQARKALEVARGNDVPLAEILARIAFWERREDLGPGALVDLVAKARPGRPAAADWPEPRRTGRTMHIGPGQRHDPTAAERDPNVGTW